MARDIQKVGVVGLGTMGAGIAEVFARNGIPVVGVEYDDAALARGRGHLEHSTDRAVRRGKLTEEGQRELLGRIAFTTSLNRLSDVDLVVEAVPERMDLKTQVFAALDRICKPEDRKSTRLNSSHMSISYAVFCLK